MSPSASHLKIKLLLLNLATLLFLAGHLSPAAAQPSMSEGFEGQPFPTSQAMLVRNQSDVIGTNASCWQRLVGSPWSAHSGNAHAVADFHCTDGTNTISAWLITRQFTGLQNGSQLTFWTRTAAGRPEFPDRLQVRLCLDTTPDSCGAVGSTGSTSSDVGAFTTLLLDINPTLAPGVYPSAYTQFTHTFSGLPPGDFAGRLAFRYFVNSGGPTGANSNAVSVDQLFLTNLVPVELMTFEVD